MFFWLIRGHAAEGLQWYEQILNPPFLPPATELRAAIGAAIMWYAGEHARARTGATRSLGLAHAAGDREMVAQAEHLLGYVEYALGNMNAARDQFTHSVEGFRTLSIPWGTGYSLSGMAAVALAIGNAGDAERLLEDAESVLRHDGPWFLSLGRYMRAVMAVRRGTPIKRSRWCARVSHASGRSMTSSRSSTRWFRWPPRWHSRATTHGWRGFWGPGTPSSIVRGSRLSIHQCTIFENRRNARRVHTSARIAGPRRTQRAATLQSTCC